MTVSGRDKMLMLLKPIADIPVTSPAPGFVDFPYILTA